MNRFENLTKAYHNIKFLENQEKKSHQFEFRPQAPDPSIPYEFKPFRVPKSNSRKQKTARDCQAKLLAFWELKKNITSLDETIMFIPTTSKRLKMIFGNYRAVSRAIDVMIECGLIAEYDEKYSFNHYKTNHSKKYVFNKPAWLLFVNYCKENNILAYQYKKRKKVNIDTIVDTFDLAFTASRVEFTSKGVFYKPLDMSCQQFEDFLYECLENNYDNEIAKKKADIDYVNKTFFADSPELWTTFEPTFTWDKRKTKVTKIGIRATNSIVSAKKTKEDGDPEYLIYRDDLMKKYGTMHEFDVTSSISRATYLLNTGKWMPMNVDFYKLIWDDLCETDKSFAKQEWNAENREMIKHFFMRGYFDTHSMIAAHTKRAISLKGNYKAEDWKDLDETMRMYKKSVEKVLGGRLYDSEIFFHESNIYAEVAKRILSKGYKLMQIYDGFYTDKPVEDIEEIIEDCAMSYYERYKEICNKRNKMIVKESSKTIKEYEKIIKYKESNKEEEKVIIDTIVDTFEQATNTKQKITNLVDEAMKNDECEHIEKDRMQPNEKTKRKKRIIVIKKNF